MSVHDTENELIFEEYSEQTPDLRFELIQLAKDYYAVQNEQVKSHIETQIKNGISRMMNQSDDATFDSVVEFRDMINDIMITGSEDQDEYNSERAAERRMEQWGQERGY